mgnify:CR=1 FL=1
MKTIVEFSKEIQLHFDIPKEHIPFLKMDSFYKVMNYIEMISKAMMGMIRKNKNVYKEHNDIDTYKKMKKELDITYRLAWKKINKKFNFEVEKLINDDHPNIDKSQFKRLKKGVIDLVKERINDKHEAIEEAIEQLSMVSYLLLKDNSTQLINNTFFKGNMYEEL